jgi:hypothetical protein
MAGGPKKARCSEMAMATTDWLHKLNDWTHAVDRFRIDDLQKTHREQPGGSTPENPPGATKPETAGDAERKAGEADQDAQPLAENEKETRPGSIPPKYRTKPMSYKRAAQYIGKGTSKDAGEWMSNAVAAGGYRCEHITRQNHVFDIRDFPKNVWPEIRPKLTPTDPK